MNLKTINFCTGFVALASLIGFAATRAATAGSAGTAVAVVSATNAFSLETHQCSYCHTIHGGSGGPTLLNAADVEVLCQTCHGAGGTSPLKAEVHTNVSASEYLPFRVTCIECHMPHSSLMNWLGGQNIRLVGVDAEGTGLASVISPTGEGVRYVVFESRGTGFGWPSLHSFADDDEDNNDYWDGICETCHTETRNHQNTSSGNHSHNTGKSCTDRCHKHTTNFNRR